MRVEVTPRRADAVPGQPLAVVVTIANTSTVIGGYAIRVLGADPSWVQLDSQQISLFPDETRTVIAQITVPKGISAGLRRIAIQVRELTPPEDSTVAEIDLTVPAAKGMQVRLDPLAVTGGHRGNFSVLVENTGNTVVAGRLAGDDSENKVRFSFEPETISLAAGEHAVIDLKATARQHLMGSPTVRVLSIYLDEAVPDAFFSAPEHADEDPARDDKGALALGTFIQRPVLSRGPISLFGLLAAVTIFAIVITLALSRLVGQSAADRNLALQVAAARDAVATSGSSSVSGTVRLLTSGTPVRGVAVNAFAATDVTTPVATTATDAKGAYSIANLPAGDYKLSFRGAGFVELWYPGAVTDADATTITLKEGQNQVGLDVRLGGVPATISGNVVGDDVSAATLFLMSATGAGSRTGTGSTTGSTIGAGTPAAAASGTGSGPGAQAGSTGVVAPPDNGEAVVRSIPIGADGTFSLTSVPSPTIYDLVVTKKGYATSTQRIDIGAGETRTGVQIRLQKGDGLISGHVNSAAGGLGGVTLTATAGQSTASTVSLTTDDLGAFTLRGLATPAAFTVVASKAGYASQTLTLSVSAGQKLTGVVITLGQSSGSLSGMVTVQSAAVAGQSSTTPGVGVSVTITNGQLTVQTVTETGQNGSTPGAWSTGGLALPGTYTLTFGRTDLAAQTVSVSLDSNGSITPGSLGATISAKSIRTTMQSATAILYGNVTQPRLVGDVVRTGPRGEATVTLSTGTSSYTLTTASVSNSSGSAGDYRFGAIPPGTYTESVSVGGTSPTTRLITVRAGEAQRQDFPLPRAATISGKVVGTDRTLRAGWTVILYVASKYPNDARQTTTTNSTGGFSFSNVDAPQSYVIEVRPGPGAAPTGSATIQLAASEQYGTPADLKHPSLTITADPNG